jgi:hypothetical protein
MVRVRFPLLRIGRRCQNRFERLGSFRAQKWIVHGVNLGGNSLKPLSHTQRSGTPDIAFLFVGDRHDGSKEALQQAQDNIQAEQTSAGLVHLEWKVIRLGKLVNRAKAAGAIETGGRIVVARAPSAFSPASWGGVSPP